MINKPDPVEIDFSDVIWEKSPFSGGSDNCVEFGTVGQFIAIRDSKNPTQTPLVYTRAEIGALLDGAKSGAFDHLR
ncbi:DUF397 domain-containing protein [Streptomyces sp. XY431]|uniref:DUF397 domain-containing protein n=1 Tax=Streptomyces sp. XY431 TaxID=1415562 RepID=UPI0006B029AB|nr:DUF397 domain-containing protein [Streptomyces sp. XY431]